jgi:hypothetical protein
MNNSSDLKLIKKARAEKILNQIQARESTTKQTIETRKKILLGAMLQEWVRTGEIEQARVETGLSGYLVRQRDRDLFGLDKTAGSGEGERAGVAIS